MKSNESVENDIGSKNLNLNIINKNSSHVRMDNSAGGLSKIHLEGSGNLTLEGVLPTSVKDIVSETPILTEAAIASQAVSVSTDGGSDSITRCRHFSYRNGRWR